MTWEKVKLEDCCRSITDGDHQAPPKSDGGVPFVTIANIDSFNDIDFSAVMHVPQSYYDSLDEKRKPQRGDIIYSVVGSFGIPVFIRNNDSFTFQRHIAILKCKSEVNSKFLYYQMKSKYFYKQADSVAIGSAQRTITLSALKNMTVSLPSKDKQDQIADILSAYDDLIENHRRQIRLLEEGAERLYKEWFVKFHYPGTEMTHNSAGSWRTGTLKELGVFKRGSTIVSKDIIPGNIPVVAGGLTPSCFGNKSNVEGPVITISASGANAGFVHLYFSPIWASDCSYLGVGATPCLFWVYCYLKANKSVLDNLQKGAAQPHVYAKDINAISLQIPPMELLAQFENLTKPIFAKISILESAIQCLQEARDRLLPKLMSGEVKV